MQMCMCKVSLAGSWPDPFATSTLCVPNPPCPLPLNTHLLWKRSSLAGFWPDPFATSTLTPRLQGKGGKGRESWASEWGLGRTRTKDVWMCRVTRLG